MATSSTEKESAPPVEAAAETPDAPAKGVHWEKTANGASVRRIEQNDWALAGISGQDTVVWDATNGYVVPLDRFNKSALDTIRREPGFIVVD